MPLIPLLLRFFNTGKCSILNPNQNLFLMLRTCIVSACLRSLQKFERKIWQKQVAYFNIYRVQPMHSQDHLIQVVVFNCQQIIKKKITFTIFCAEATYIMFFSTDWEKQTRQVVLRTRKTKANYYLGWLKEAVP